MGGSKIPLIDGTAAEGGAFEGGILKSLGGSWLGQRPAFRNGQDRQGLLPRIRSDSGLSAKLLVFNHICAAQHWGCQHGNQGQKGKW